MPINAEIRRLTAKWSNKTGWPKFLESIEITGIRGWEGQRFTFDYPIMAVVGENGVGKSTVLQCAAAIYRPENQSSPRGLFASNFFPDTPWEKITQARIDYVVRQGLDEQPIRDSLRKPGERWRGNPERPSRPVVYVDLSRIQPVPSRVGFARLAKSQHKEASSTPFDDNRLNRFREIMGRDYDMAKMSLTDADNKREVPVIEQVGAVYSGFHQGAGETTVAELLQQDLPKYSLVLIDEIESSLHPRSQRRLVRDLAKKARELELQVILTTHSPYVLDELPLNARAHIIQVERSREIVYGVSPEFSMTKMDDIPHYECDIFVEDNRSKVLLTEIIIKHGRGLAERCRIIPFGAASTGKALGQMAQNKVLPRASCVFLDGDQGDVPGCGTLPGNDAPERVVFEDLRNQGWLAVHEKVGREYSEVSDLCSQSMNSSDHHEWVRFAANRLFLGGDILWRAMCLEWVNNVLDSQSAGEIITQIEDAIAGISGSNGTPMPIYSNETLPLFEE